MSQLFVGRQVNTRTTLHFTEGDGIWTVRNEGSLCTIISYHPTEEPYYTVLFNTNEEWDVSPETLILPSALELIAEAAE